MALIVGGVDNFILILIVIKKKKDLNVVVVWFRGHAYVWASFQLGILVLSQVVSAYYIKQVKTYRLKSVKRSDIDTRANDDDEILQFHSRYPSNRANGEIFSETGGEHAEVNPEPDNHAQEIATSETSVATTATIGIATIGSTSTRDLANDAIEEADAEIEAETEAETDGHVQPETETDANGDADNEKDVEFALSRMGSWDEPDTNDAAPKALSYRENRLVHQLLVLLGVGRVFYGLKSIMRLHHDEARLETEYYLLKLWDFLYVDLPSFVLQYYVILRTNTQFSTTIIVSLISSYLGLSFTLWRILFFEELPLVAPVVILSDEQHLSTEIQPQEEEEEEILEHPELLEAPVQTNNSTEVVLEVELASSGESADVQATAADDQASNELQSARQSGMNKSLHLQFDAKKDTPPVEKKKRALSLPDITSVLDDPNIETNEDKLKQILEQMLVQDAISTDGVLSLSGLLSVVCY
ncbi:hypothetical protein RFI_05870 [Reticulomyxa filosa]|uniref:Uncharacterized protein n=1 Tax=Reticulomyxa filosa TaxID=46433 RepID=X6NY51_RETFI|nr:hypothetical protein RFI_05870 [Reticulomyxa filosa]|eukprot:ETO31250.1 hypothetical protein RFI_05870 [Reticulomyxa filosa]